MPRSFNASFHLNSVSLWNFHISHLSYPSGKNTLVYLKSRRIEYSNLKKTNSLALSHGTFAVVYPSTIKPQNAFVHLCTSCSCFVLPCSLIWTPHQHSPTDRGGGIPRTPLCFALASSVVSPAYAVVSAQRSSQLSVMAETPCGRLIFTLSQVKSTKWRCRHKSLTTTQGQANKRNVSVHVFHLCKNETVQEALNFCICVYVCLDEEKETTALLLKNSIKYFIHSSCFEECWADLHGVSVCISLSKSVWRVCRTGSMLAWVSMIVIQ